MTYRVELTARAVRDLRCLYRTINGSESLTAHKWFNGLEAAIMGLSENPDRHGVTSENAALRHLLYRSRSYVYRVIFLVDDGDKVVSVVYIRHGSQKPLTSEGRDS